MKKLLALSLAFILLVSCLLGCEQNAAPTTAAPTTQATEPTLDAESAAILTQRRQLVADYMRSMANYVWRAEETVDYFTSGQTILHIEAGRLYRGIPYTHAANTLNAFCSFTTENADGTATLSGIHPNLMGNLKDARVGNDCSGAVQTAWAQLGADIQPKITTYMIPANGFIRLGNFYAPAENNKGSNGLCVANGEQVMYESYAFLQLADAVVYAKASGHTMLVTGNTVVRKEDGTIDGENSFITTVHQTSSYMKKETKAFDETYGEDVYQIYGIDDVYTYAKLFESGYLPLTCQALTDPNWQIPEPAVTDSVTQPGAENMFEGEFVSNYFISFVDCIVKDESGAVVQQARAFSDRDSIRNFRLSGFQADPTMVQGGVDVSLLPAGTYEISFVCQIVTGESFTVRQLQYICE